MSKFLYIFLLFCTLNAEDFISKMEYARMLYQNPRGIGCNKCHGENGEGKLIANYKQKDTKNGKLSTLSLRAPQINNMDFESFKKSINKSTGMMPSYFLTDAEILTLYEYLQSKKEQQ